MLTWLEKKPVQINGTTLTQRDRKRIGPNSIKAGTKEEEKKEKQRNEKHETRNEIKNRKGRRTCETTWSSGRPLRMRSSDSPSSSFAGSDNTFSLMSAERGFTQCSCTATTCSTNKAIENQYLVRGSQILSGLTKFESTFHSRKQVQIVPILKSKLGLGVKFVSTGHRGERIVLL